MIEKLSIRNFRGLKSLDIPELSRINLFSGKNNAGKSSVLEGLFLMFDHASPESFVKINRFRGLPVSTDPSGLWAPAFYNLDTGSNLEIYMRFRGEDIKVEYTRDDSFVPSDKSGTPEDIFNQFVSSAKSNYTLKMKYTQGDIVEAGHFVAGPGGIMREVSRNGNTEELIPLPFTQFINSSIAVNDQIITEWFGKMELAGRKQEIVDILKIIEPQITDVTAIAAQGQTQLYAKIGDRLLPLKLAGDGMGRILFITLSMFANRNAIILIDEIETGFHYSMHSKLWEVIASVAEKNNCQVIATSHSYECIVGAVEGIGKAGMENNFRYYRIESSGDENRVFGYSGDLIRYAVDRNMEVR